MADLERHLFNIQRFQILSQFVNDGGDGVISPAYAFAWYEGVYPIFHESAPWHVGYDDCFRTSKEDTEQLLFFLGDLWDEKKTISFWDLESHYGVKANMVDGPIWTRSTLLSACQYFRLDRRFDDKFWAAVSEQGKSPIEAASINSRFSAGQVYFQ